MKRFIYLTLGLAVFAIALCCLCLPRASAQAAPKDSTTATTAAELQERIEHSNQLVREQEDRARRVESLLGAKERMMNKQEAAFSRFQKSSDAWELRQKQLSEVSGFVAEVILNGSDGINADAAVGKKLSHYQLPRPPGVKTGGWPGAGEFEANGVGFTWRF